MKRPKVQVDLKKRLIATMQRQGLSLERERVAAWVIEKIAPEILKIIAEEVRLVRREQVRKEATK